MAFEPVPEGGVFRYGTAMRPAEELQSFAPPPVQEQQIQPQAERPAVTPSTRPSAQPRPVREPDFFSTETLADVARSQLAGTERGLVGLLGLPGDIGQLTDIAGPMARYYGSRAFGTSAEDAQKAYDQAMERLRASQTPQEREGRRGRLFGINFPTSSSVIEGASFIPGITYEPQTRAGRLAHTIGEFMGSAPLAEVAAPIQAARGLTTAGQAAARIGRSAISPASVVGGLGSGAAGEMMHGEEGETGARLAGGIAGTVAGGSLGSMAARGARAVAGSPEAAALEAARRGLGQKGLSLDEAARLAEAGHDVRLTDVAGMKVPTQRALGRQVESEAAQDVLSGLSQRSSVSRDNVASQIDNIYGSRIDPFVTAQNASQEARKILSPEYTRVFSLPSAQSIWSPELANLTNTSAGRNALNTAFDNLTHLKGTPVSLDQYLARDAAGNLALRPGVTGLPLEVWDQVKKNLDAQVNNLYNSPIARDSAAGAALKAERDRMRGVLDNAVGEYANLRAEAQRYILGNNAFEAGQNLVQLLSGRSPKAARQLSEFNSKVPNFTKNERSFLSQGVASNISTQPDVAARIFMANDARAMRALENALGPDEFNKIRDVMTVHDLAMNMQRLTPKLAREIPNWGGAPVGYFLMNLVQPGMSLGHAAASAVGYGAVAARNAIKDRNAGRLLELINSNDPAVLRQLAEEASRNPELSRTLAGLGATMRAAYATYGLEGGQRPQQSQRFAGGRVGRASGGRLVRNDHSARAAALIRAADAAKKAHNSTTKDILEQPDEAVAKALSIANQAI